MPLEGENEKKILTLKNIKSNELSLVFSKIVSKGLCCDKVWGISISISFRGIYRKSLLKIIIFIQNPFVYPSKNFA